MDKSIPFYGVLMTRRDPSAYPRYSLPPGYAFSFFQPGQESEWIDLQIRTGQIESQERGTVYFHQEYLSRPELVPQRLFFVRAADGRAVGTSSIWHGEHFGQELPRVHWVSVLPEYQGQGIGKAMLTRTLDLYHELGFKDFLYLTTQTWSYKAIRLYLSFGFTPYKGPKPVNWSNAADHFEAEQEAAWSLIMGKIQDWETALSLNRLAKGL